MRSKTFVTVTFFSLAIVCALAFAGGVSSLVQEGVMSHKGADVYYDAVHNARHLWNRANKRHRVAYHTVSGFNSFYRALGEEGFDVHVETWKPFNRATLDKYDVFFIGEQTYHARFMDAHQRKDLVDWVRDGGGLFTLIEHTNAHYMAEVFDLLYKELPVKVRRDSIGDLNQPGPVSPTWIDMTSDQSHPTTQGVEEFRFYNGASLDTPHGVLFSKSSSWSDDHNPAERPIQNGNKKRDPGELSGPLAGAAAFEFGKGRVVVISDHNAMSNPTMYWGDHYRFVFNSMKWLAGAHFNWDVLWIVLAVAIFVALWFFRRRYSSHLVISRATVGGGTLVLLLMVGGSQCNRSESYDLFVHTGNAAAMKFMTKKASGFFSMYGQWTKEPQLRPWAHRDLKAGYDSLFLAAPTESYGDQQLEMIDDYLDRGKNVVYLANVTSLESPAGRQLQKRFEFAVKLDRGFSVPGRRPFIVHGPRKWTESIFRMYVYGAAIGTTVVSGIEPKVYLTKGNYHIGEKGWRNKKHVFDILSTKSVGGGEFWLVMPTDLFTDHSLKNLYQDGDVVRQQMAEFLIRLAKFSAGDDSVYYVD